MIDRLKRFIRKPTSFNVVVNTLGNYLNIFFTALFALILVRILSPDQYGVLSVLLGIAYVLSNILDFGTTATIYSQVPILYEQKSERLYQFIKSTYFFQSLFSFIVIGILFLFFPLLDSVFFKTGAPPAELYLTAISVLFLIWQNFVQNIMFAAKQFFKANLYLNIANIFKTIILFGMVLSGAISVGSVIFVFGIVGPLIFFVLLLSEKMGLVKLLIKAPIKKDEFKFGYTFTYFFASQFFNLGLRMDLFLLSYFLIDKSLVGYYGLSQKIILTIITTIVSITQVLSPGFSQAKTKSQSLYQLKNGFFYLLIPSILFVVLYFIPPFIYSITFTEKFVLAAPITKSLSLPFILYALGSLPTLFLLYTCRKPMYILISNIFFFLIVSGVCYVLIPTMNVKGPPLALFAALAFMTGIQVVAGVYEFKRLPNK